MTVELIDRMGDEQRIIDAAQVSTKGAYAKDYTKSPGIRNWWKRFTHTGGWHRPTNVTPKLNTGLLKWLYRSRHASPFEHCVMTFRVEAPIFITREILRHRVSSFNEESGRYKVLKGVFFVPGKGRNLAQIGKVGNYEFVPGTPAQRFIAGLTSRLAPGAAWFFYRIMIKAGVSREVSRIVLPVGLYSSLYYTANLRSLLNFISLRVDWGEDAAIRSHPQAEIQEVGLKIAAAVAKAYPNVWQGFVESGYKPV